MKTRSQSKRKPSGTQPEKVALKIGEVASALGVSKQHVLNLIDCGDLAAFDIGACRMHHWRVAKESLAHYQAKKSNLNLGGVK
jgi:hypothetical protein